MSENTNPQGDSGAQDAPDGASNEPAGKTYTDEEISRLIGKARNEERRKASEKYSDYETLKAAAEEKKTAEDRLADLEKQYAQSQANSLRLRVAGDWNVPTKRGEDGEPSDADLFLTGTDEETLIAQAKRYSDLMEQRKTNQPYVSREGANPRPKPSSTQEFLSTLTGRGQ
ncbi:hypothetical protein [Gordonia cholesterolivorans]|uniref:Scaffolding protein n=1 Tax=Gordonia cholesterolivorans TaxID=559625 RepID=A0ABP5V5B1_9ACTN